MIASVQKDTSSRPGENRFSKTIDEEATNDNDLYVVLQVRTMMPHCKMLCVEIYRVIGVMNPERLGL